VSSPGASSANPGPPSISILVRSIINYNSYYLTLPIWEKAWELGTDSRAPSDRVTG